MKTGCQALYAEWSLVFLQMYAMPVFDMIEDFSQRKGIKSKFFTRVVMRTVFVVFTAFIGITLPFFGGRSQLIHHHQVGMVAWSVLIRVVLSQCFTSGMATAYTAQVTLTFT